jgi:hypothetical protein
MNIVLYESKKKSRFDTKFKLRETLFYNTSKIFLNLKNVFLEVIRERISCFSHSTK